MKPLFNAIHDEIKKVVETYLVHVPDDQKEKMIAHAEAAAIKITEVAVEAGARGLVEGAKQ